MPNSQSGQRSVLRHNGRLGCFPRTWSFDSVSQPRLPCRKMGKFNAILASRSGSVKMDCCVELARRGSKRSAVTSQSVQVSPILGNPTVLMASKISAELRCTNPSAVPGSKRSRCPSPTSTLRFEHRQPAKLRRGLSASHPPEASVWIP